MSSNIFQDIQNKRNEFKKYAQRALENKWINEETFNEIINKVKNDKLTIGVIGQMKCGKSTFLNALIFQDEILPAATTPMTASLSVITYGEQKKLEVEFYTTNEWEDLKYQASRNLEEVKADENLQSKIKAAKEIVSKSITIQNEIGKLLGTTKQDSFETLIEYVGAEGKYIAITKSVKIFYPLDNLKGVEVVDTPGFNDPVVSREERTKRFLSKADVVVMLLYAGQPFTSVDKDIIFNKVRTVGVGKVLIGINKYDIPYRSAETPKEIVTNVKNELQKASKEYPNSPIVELVTEHDPLLISANMALMSKLPISKITQKNNVGEKKDGWAFYYDDMCDVFEISSQSEMFEKSLMKYFEEAIKDIVTKSKDEILIRKPKNQIKQIGESKNDELVKELTEVSNNLKILETPDGELEELLKSSEKAKKRIERKIDNLETDLFEVLLKNIKKITYNTDDSFAASEKKIYAIIEDTSLWSLEGKFESLYSYEFGNLERKTKRDFGNFNDEINLAIKKEISNFLYDIEEIADKYLEDFHIKDYFGKIKSELLGEVVNITIYDLLPQYKNLTEEEKSSLLANIGEFVLVSTFAIPIAIFELANIRDDLREFVNHQFLKFDTEGIGQNVKANGYKLIENVTKLLIDDFITPIEQKISDTIEKKSNKENELKSNKEKLEVLKTAKSLIETQIEEMKVLENQF
nr:dynamin family protein [uncultured Flavobacterium sp.]